MKRKLLSLALAAVSLGALAQGGSLLEINYDGITMSLSYQIELHLPSGLLMWCTERMPGNSLNRRMLLPSRLSRVWRCLTWNFVIVLFPTLGSASRSLLKGLILLL